MFSRQIFGAFGGLLLAALLPITAAKACACCAEPGDRFDRTEAIDEYALGVLEAVRFDSQARLYTTAADWSEQVKGITNPKESDLYSLTFSSTARAWTFDLKDAAGTKGRLTLRLPRRVHKFHADTKPQAQTSGTYVPTTLYKEWRLAGGVSGNGMFTFKKSPNSRAQLILHGTGNGCTSPDQFTHWTLDVTGHGVQFRFFGRLRSAG